MESGLSFVGLGVPSETPTWGRMLSEGRDYMDSAWWLTMFPGLAILLLVLVINVLGEQLRDYADPRLHAQ
jgi:peptide/nickel transport system permease protein